MKETHYLIAATRSAIEAGDAILDIYDSEFEVETKADQSPLTIADKRSHEIIQAGLSQFEIPLISEEGRNIPYEERKAWHTAWIVDPLDGTKEFIKRNGEFTVNIALIENQKPVLGVVFAPVPRWLYVATVDIGAYKISGSALDGIFTNSTSPIEKQLTALLDRGEKLPAAHQERKRYTIVGSRSHGTPELEAFVEKKRSEKGEVDFIAAGSSLKICLVAEGSADIYPRLGPTMEWDTAAGQAIAECAGARVYLHEDGGALRYNRENQLNPYFIVERVN
ncbi:MAG: 3'(2'),5'-bisphosphate nucleotidase CysQ [Desulfobacteraceae bacterium]|jgi:3'(2'), 5'-bisphosphate nucleotidase